MVSAIPNLVTNLYLYLSALFYILCIVFDSNTPGEKMRYVIILLFLGTHLFAFQLDSFQFSNKVINDSTESTRTAQSINHILISQQQISEIPFNDFKNIISLFPSVIIKGNL